MSGDEEIVNVGFIAMNMKGELALVAEPVPGNSPKFYIGREAASTALSVQQKNGKISIRPGMTISPHADFGEDGSAKISSDEISIAFDTADVAMGIASSALSALLDDDQHEQIMGLIYALASANLDKEDFESRTDKELSEVTDRIYENSNKRGAPDDLLRGDVIVHVSTGAKDGRLVSEKMPSELADGIAKQIKASGLEISRLIDLLDDPRYPIVEEGAIELAVELSKEIEEGL